jgi:chromosome segregation ATPase
LRKCQDYLSVELSKTSSNEHEHQQLKQTIQLSKEQIDKLQQDLHQTKIQNEQYEYTIQDLNSRNELIETKLIETMTLIDSRNKTLIDFEQQMDRLKIELIQKHKELIDKQSQIDELEQIVIDKTGEVAELTETLETGLVKSHHREKFAEDNASKALHDVKVLQREVEKRFSNQQNFPFSLFK